MTEIAENRREKILLWPIMKFVGGITGEKVIEIDGIQEKVFLFDYYKLRGVCLFNGKIMLNENIMETEEIMKASFLHEKRHREQEGLMRKLGGWGQSIFLSPPGLLAGAVLAFLLTLSAANYFSAGFWPLTKPVSGLGFLAGLYLICAVLSYRLELDADFYVMDCLGIEDFDKAHQQAKDIFPDPPIWKPILVYPSHPPIWLTKKLYKRFRSA